MCLSVTFSLVMFPPQMPHPSELVMGMPLVKDPHSPWTGPAAPSCETPAQPAPAHRCDHPGGCKCRRNVLDPPQRRSRAPSPALHQSCSNRYKRHQSRQLFTRKAVFLADFAVVGNHHKASVVRDRKTGLSRDFLRGTGHRCQGADCPFSSHMAASTTPLPRPYRGSRPQPATP